MPMCISTGVLHFSVYTCFCDMSSCPSSLRVPRDLFEGACTEILSRHLWWGWWRSCPRPLQEICAERAFIEILHRDLARRPLLQILYRDVVNSKDLAQRFCVKILARDLTLRCLTEIFCQDLFKTPCTDSLPQGSCTATLFRELE